MERRTRELLDLVEDELLNGTKAGKELAIIMSALRGPDMAYDSWGLEGPKGQHTVPIRRAAFPRLAAWGHVTCWGGVEQHTISFRANGAGWALGTEKQVWKRPNSSYGHFEEHAIEAAEVLGLKDSA